MAQIDIDLGTGAGNNDGDLVYTAFQTTQANFDDLYGQMDTVGNIQYFRRNIDLSGVSGNTEWEQVANAINALSGYTVPAGYKPLFKYVEPIDDVRTSTPTEPPYYNVYYYTVITGQGYYGTGTPPGGVSAVTVTKGQIVPLGSRVEQAQTDITTLGEIGATAIQTAVNASGTELVVSGLTVFRVERSGVRYEYVFNGDDDSYGASWESTSAANFIDIYDSGTIARDYSSSVTAPKQDNGDFTVDIDTLNRVIELTQDDATVTCPLNSATFIPDGAYLYVSFSGGGSHTISYPSTDGATSLTCSQGDYVKIQKRIGDEWIVKKYVNDDNGIKLASTTLTAAQIKTLGTTSIELLAAQGSGVKAIVVGMMIESTYGSVAFDANTLDIEYSGGSTIQNTVDLSFTANVSAYYLPDNPVTSIPANTAIVASGTDSTATGDSDVTVTLYYRLA